MRKIGMDISKNIALISHDRKKKEMLEWAKKNLDKLKNHNLYATGTTGSLLSSKLGLDIHSFISGPLGGDTQIGSRIVEKKIDLLIFFWDPLESLPHDPDIKALLRIAAVWNIPVACNRATADFIFSSKLMQKPYERIIVDVDDYAKNRKYTLE
ncbi:MAG: methylglyoxal synthase [Candidatus Lokiarchaeota archaeon]|nr:methylglyoxal synthase [Candidatus Lokiarchaeota archaeon]